MNNEIDINSVMLKKLKPDECGLIYDETRGILLAVCNRNGKIEIFKQKIEEL